MQISLTQEFIKESVFRIKENTPRIEKCLAELSEEEVWHRPNAHANSVANLILHLSGNITQYIISSLGGTEDQRQRDLEFTKQGGLNKGELLNTLETTVAKAVEIIQTTNERELLSIREVQGFQLSGMGIILHVTEHYSYHTGQIALLTKIMKNKDLGFYKNLDLNIKNK